MSFEVVFTAEADSISNEHLLQHYKRNVFQEDLCFALWRPSTGEYRRTALIWEVILPHQDERSLHGNASFQPSYVTRAIQMARQRGAGLAFMHSHPGPGWQGMSAADVDAERDALAYPAAATGLPLVGLTIGSDGYWSARFWERNGTEMHRSWCEKVRVVGPKSYRIDFNDDLVPPPLRREILRRTFDTWGRQSQNTISRLRVGIVGLGSVGCIVAETMARVGVEQVTLIDPDKVERHNLDRLLYGTVKDIGKLKVETAMGAMRRNATAQNIQVSIYPVSLQDMTAYKAALDCDILFSCVDRPLPRDVLNYISQAHLIPVIDGGVEVETHRQDDCLFSAHWRAHIVTPYHQCLRCNGQYNSSAVVMELDGSLDAPSYVSNLPAEERFRNQNVFPFSESVAAMEVNLMLRYLLAADWWPVVGQQDYQFVTGETRVINEECHPNCSFRERRALGDTENPFYLIERAEGSPKVGWRGWVRMLDRVLRRS
ncbi:MAG: ThiF family adenylyltransferase [Deltaproteobacteria bacterium]|nr:ThiF family adenylyltransferase [Deltaproteobacteria bacterium]